MAGALTTWLRARSDEQLSELLFLRPDLATPTPGDIAVLSARATVRVSVLRALESVDRPTLQVLEALVLLGGSADAAALLDVLPGATQEHLDIAVLRLQSLALVFDDDSRITAPQTVRDIVDDRVAGLGRSARRLLDLQTSERLTALGQVFALDLPAGRDARLELLSTAYRSPELATRLEALDPAERAVLDRLDAASSVGSLPGAMRLQPLAKADTPVRAVLARGLLLAVDPDTVELPRELGLLLRGRAPVGPAAIETPRPQGKTLDRAAVDSTGAGQAAETVRLTEALLELVAEAPPASLRAGGVSVRDLRRLSRSLDASEPITALLLEICFAAGMIDRTSDLEPLWLPTTAYDAWLLRDLAGRWITLVSAWLTSPRAPGAVGERDIGTNKVVAALGPDASRPAAAVFRREALRYLAELEPGTPLRVPEALEALDWRAPRRLSRSKESSVRWALDEAATLGLTGRGALTKFGRKLLDGDTEGASAALNKELPPAIFTVMLQADLTAVAPGRLATEVARELSRCADVESSGAASVLRFSDASIRRALDTGMSREELHAFLERVSSTPVPQTLTYLVDDVARRHGILRVGAAGAYLRCDDEALLAEAVSAKATQALGLRWLAPTVAVAEAGPQQLLEGLRAAGFAPAVEGDSGAVTLGRPGHRRTPHRARVSRVEAPSLSEAQLERALRQLRSGDEATLAGRRHPGPLDRARDGGSPVPVIDRSLEATLAVIAEAVREVTRLTLTYIDPTGRTTERVVVPKALESGFLSAFDERAKVTRTFAVRNIASVAAAT